jgi:hypothetical protein
MPTLPLRLRVRSLLGLAFCLASVPGCPAGAETTCPECIIHSASYTIGPNPPHTQIARVWMSSRGVFTGHCPIDDRSSCTLTDGRAIATTETGPRRDRLPWASNGGDSITVTIEVDRVSTNGGPVPAVERPPVTIEE